MKNPTTTLATIAAIASIILTGAAFWLSYEHLHDVAHTHGLTDQIRAWAWPATVDLFIVVGEVLYLRAALAQRNDWWAIGLTVAGSGGSIALNVAGVGADANPMDYVVAAVPPVAALLAFGAIMRQIHGALTQSAAAASLHTICAGPDGRLFLRRPTPRKTPAPTQPAGPVGSRVADVAALLGRSHAPAVYFVTNGTRVKIGTTQNLRERIRTLCLRVDDIALVLHGGQDHERSLHERFAEHRAGDTEWFELAGDLAAFVATGGASPAPVPVADPAPTEAAPVANETPTPVDSANASERQNGPATGASSSAKKADDMAAAPRPRTPRTGASSKRNGRRSMTEWVDLAGPVFHAEFERLRRQPTGDEFAEAIKKARLGTVSASTAKNIRAEILDRAELPALD